jgi:hypothetical protein
MPPRLSPAPKDFHKTALGRIVNGDSLDVLATYKDKTVDLIMTSPPFGLVRKKDYGNVEASEYVEWFRPFGEQEAEHDDIASDNSQAHAPPRRRPGPRSDAGIREPHHCGT